MKQTSAFANIQVIEKDGRPQYVVIPYEDYLRLLPEEQEEDDVLPDEVVGLIIKEEINLVRAWRRHLGLTKGEVAKRAGLSSSVLAKLESCDNFRPTPALERLASAMGLSVEQLRD